MTGSAQKNRIRSLNPKQKLPKSVSLRNQKSWPEDPWVTTTTQPIDTIMRTSTGMHYGTLSGYVTKGVKKAPTFVTYAADGSGNFASCETAGAPAVGVVQKTTESVKGIVAIALLGCSASTLLVLAGEAIKCGDFLVTDAGGHAVPLKDEEEGTQYVLGRAIANAVKGSLVSFDPGLAYPVIKQ